MNLMKFIYLILINKYENMNDKKNLDLQHLKFIGF
jgi:hypothetical protein